MEHQDTSLAASVPDATAADYDALTRGAGVRRLSGRIVVRMVGDDRVTFLHGMCSADIQHAGSGEVVAGLFLTEHAHLIADFFAWIVSDAILIDIDAALWDKARSHLERLLVADDVEFENTDL